MHIPDNYLSPATCAVMAAAMIPVWAVSIKKVKDEISAKKLPLMGISAAFSFLIMMFNIPLPGGTTGHAVGATLISLLLGPWAACISVSVSLLIQALFFSDGGILSFGANCFNMAFMMPFAGYFIYQLIRKIIKSDTAAYPAAFASAYLAINIAALCAAVEFGLQPLLFKDALGHPLYAPYPLAFSVPAMLVPHLLAAGVLEGLITVGVYAYIKRLSPEMIRGEQKVKTGPLYALILAMAALTPLGLLAAGTAWGEWAADEIKTLLGFVPAGMAKATPLVGEYHAPLPDYHLPVLKNDIAGYVISAVIGAAVVIVLFKVISEIMKKKNSVKKEIQD